MNMRSNSLQALAPDLATGALPDWGMLAEQASPQWLGEAWLNWLTQRVPGIVRAVIMVEAEQGPQLNSVAVRPAGSAIEHLGPLIAQAAGIGLPLVRERADAPGQWVLVMPLVQTQATGQGQPMVRRTRCAIAIELQTSDEALRAFALSLMQGAIGWWQAWLAHHTQGDAHVHLQRSRVLFDLTLAVLSQPGFDEAALAWVNGLAKRLGARQVQLGWLNAKGQLELLSRSGAAWHDERSSLVLQATQAMNEAIDQGKPLVCTAAQAASGVSALAQYAHLVQAPEVAALALHGEDGAIGALLIEHEAGSLAPLLDELDTQALLLAPLLQLKHQGERSLWSHAQASLQHSAQLLTGSRYPGVKLGVLAVAALLLLSAIVPVTYRVTAPSLIEGEVQRAAVAPFQGYIRSGLVRAGDVVKRGQVLATLEDKDLALEKRRWEAELDMASRKEREAMASGNRVDQRLASAQVNQARAQLDLAQDRLSRTEVVAPFDAVVVKGDLSQQLGSPVEQGKVLFELAPLDAWRVILKVDERDITFVQPGQSGQAVLASLPGHPQQIKVKRVTSVAVAEEGRNHFRVEAEIVPQADASAADKPVALRPGMEGVSKVDTPARSLLWIATHRLRDWLRLSIWEWGP
jgi:Barrel-sandwich domain of CusB or HlyD membrane-fusion